MSPSLTTIPPPGAESYHGDLLSSGNGELPPGNRVATYDCSKGMEAAKLDCIKSNGPMLD